MIMKTSNLTLELILSTRKIIKLTDEFKGKNLSELYFKIANEKSEKGLATIINAFGEVDGKTPFNGDINKVYDFIDEYKKENKKSYEEIYREIAEVINEEGFFTNKMTKEQLTEQLNNPMSSIDLQETIKTAVNNVMSEMATNEFKGYKS